MKSIPFQSTRIEEQQSVGEIIGLLNQIGFTDIIQRNRDGDYMIMAKSGQTVFQWDIKVDPIMEAIRKSLSDRAKRKIHQYPDDPEVQRILKDTRQQASRIGWRLMREHIKSLVDSIKLGVVDISEAFAGNLLITNKAGQNVKLSDQIKASVASGKLDLSGFGIALLEDKR